MTRSNNRRTKQKSLPGGQLPSSGVGGKDKKSAPAKAKKKFFGTKNKAPPFKRHGPPPTPFAKRDKNHRSNANGIGLAAKRAGGPKREFRFHLPPMTASSSSSYQQAPWEGSAPNPGTASTVSSNAPFSASSPLDSRDGRMGSNSGRSICSRLSAGPMPTEGIPPILLDALDRELEQFGAFVRLTPVEVQARNRVAGAVQKAATLQYSGANVQPFGSFATPAVCCFLSDIDLAVDGVVTFPSGDSRVIDNSAKASRKRKRGGSEEPASKQQVPTDLKRERVKQWVLALESVDVANESSQGVVGDETVSPDAEASNQVSEKDLDSSKRTADTDPTSLHSQESDQDSADKLSSLGDWVRSNTTISTLTSVMSDTDSDDDDDDDAQCDTSGMEVSMNVAPATMTIDKETRELCIDALKRIKRKLEKQVRVNRRDGPGCQLIKARVPIVKLQLPAFEVDVAVAGCNGADTAAYSGDQAARFRSFASVVLFLKILLYQNKLDVPFEGGLGSYKLYVLVAYHIEKHLEQGGTDRPGEVLLAFLFRYGKVTRSYVGEAVSDYFRTHLSVTSMIECSGGSADLSNVSLIHNCRQLFDMAWHRLQSKILASRSDPPSSFLDSLVDSSQLRRERDKRLQFATLTLNTSVYLK